MGDHDPLNRRSQTSYVFDRTGVAMSAIALVFFVIVGGALYFLPTIAARGGDRVGPVFVLNLFLGWTLIGWVAAFAIAASSKDVRKSKTCPACAEAVLAEAQVCRYCGHAFVPTTPTIEPTILPKVDEIAYGHEMNRVAKPVRIVEQAPKVAVFLAVFALATWGVIRLYGQQPTEAPPQAQGERVAAPKPASYIVVPEPDPTAQGELLYRWATANAPLVPLGR
jgi:hypothetical protein